MRVVCEDITNLLSAAFEHECSDRGDYETQDNDTSNRIRKEKSTTEMCSWRKVANSNSEQGIVCPVKSIKKAPVLYLGVDSCTTEKVDTENDRLQHQGPLASCQVVLSTV